MSCRSNLRGRLYIPYQPGIGECAARKRNGEAPVTRQGSFVQHIDCAHDGNMTTLDPVRDPAGEIAARIEPAAGEQMCRECFDQRLGGWFDRHYGRGGEA
jgi:hypothetical protein